MKKKILAVSVAALLPMLLSAGTANAGMVVGYVYHGSDFAQSTGWTEYPRDREADGNGVYANIWLESGNFMTFLWDGNGSQPGGNSYSYGSAILGHQVCEDHVFPCSSWIWG